MIPQDASAALRQHRWLYLLRGVVAIAFAVLTLRWPGATLVVLMAFIAVYALFDGAFSIGFAFRLRRWFGRWWVLLVQGLISLAFGILVFLVPTLSLIYIVVSVALWMLWTSIAHFIMARAQRAMGGSGLWSVVVGALTFALAVLAIFYPQTTIAAVLALIAWFALFIGIAQLMVAFRVKAAAKRLATI